MNTDVQVLPHVLLTLPIGGLQPFDPGVALLCAAGVAVGAEFLRYLGENVTVVRVASYPLLDLNQGQRSYYKVYWNYEQFQFWENTHVMPFVADICFKVYQETERLNSVIVKVIMIHDPWGTWGSPQSSRRMMVSLSDQGTFFLSSWMPAADSEETALVSG